jgi:DNA-binding MarR family transcriptional regulator
MLVTTADAGDARRRVVTLTTLGRAFVDAHIADALAITEETLAGLDAAERATLLGLLAKMR